MNVLKCLWWAQTGYAVKFFMLKLSLGSGLRLVKFTVDMNKWTTAVEGVYINARPQDVQGLPTTPTGTPENLVNATLEVLSTAGSVQSLACQVLELKNTIDVSFASQLDPLNAFVADRSGSNSTVGSVFVESNRLLAVLPYSDHTNLVNTAVFTSTPRTVKVTGLQIWSSGAQTPASASPSSCRSSNVAVLQTQSPCTALLSGNEVTGGQVNVTQCWGSLCATMPYLVWAPGGLRVSLVIDDPVLNLVTGWKNTNLPQPVPGGEDSYFGSLQLRAKQSKL